MMPSSKMYLNMVFLGVTLSLLTACSSGRHTRLASFDEAKRTIQGAMTGKAPSREESRDIGPGQYDERKGGVQTFLDKNGRNPLTVDPKTIRLQTFEGDVVSFENRRPMSTAKVLLKGQPAMLVNDTWGELRVKYETAKGHPSQDSAEKAEVLRNFLRDCHEEVHSSWPSKGYGAEDSTTLDEVYQMNGMAAKKSRSGQKVGPAAKLSGPSGM